MAVYRIYRLCGLCALLLPLVASGSGCHLMQTSRANQMIDELAGPDGMPRELCKTVLPTYTIEPPDILVIDAVHIVPRTPYSLRTLDILRIRVERALPDAPVDGLYVVELGGAVNLGPPYGPIRIVGMPVEQAQQAIAEHLRRYLKEVNLSVSLAEIAAKQQIGGQHLVGPDGTVTLGTYGSVPVVGLTISEARAAIERYLAQYLDNPEVSVDVFAYNSKVYYIIMQGAGSGDGVYRFPITGNETVLDALAQINGLSPVSSRHIWLSRPVPDQSKREVLPVDWHAVTANAKTATNYQILPGDRIFVEHDGWIAFDALVAKVTTPLERIMGFSLLGVATATRFSGNVLKGGGNANSNF